MVDEEQVRQAERARLEATAAEAELAWRQKFRAGVDAQQRASAVEEAAAAWRGSVEEVMGRSSIAGMFSEEQRAESERLLAESARRPELHDDLAAYQLPPSRLVLAPVEVPLDPERAAAVLARQIDPHALIAALQRLLAAQAADRHDDAH